MDSLDKTTGYGPDTLLSVQYFGMIKKKSELDPEKRIMFAVLEDTLMCYQKNVLANEGKLKRLYQDAERWFMEKENDWIFSFEATCRELGFNPEYIRNGILSWRNEQLKKSERDAKTGYIDDKITTQNSLPSSPDYK